MNIIAGKQRHWREEDVNNILQKAVMPPVLSSREALFTDISFRRPESAFILCKGELG